MVALAPRSGTRSLLRAGVVACGLALVATAAAAQQRTEGETAPQPPGVVLSDVAPLPAEDRSSVGGALLLQQDPVRARQQQQKAADERTGIPSAIGRSVTRLMERARTWDDVREADATPPSQR